MGCSQTRNQVARPNKVMPNLEQKAKLKSKYIIVPKILGTGKTGTVYAASLRSDPDTKVAIKVINKIKNKDNMSRVQHEIKVLKSLSHPNIVKYIECYENEYSLYIVMENCTRGELSHVIKRKVRGNHCFTEHEAREIVGKIFEAVQYCHSQGVIHGNLNPANIMFAKDHTLKLIDFDGIGKHSVLEGYQAFIAPEVSKGGQPNKLSDIWAIGMILYVLLVGRYPFSDDSYEFNDKLWNGISDNAKNLIKSMLEVDPTKRMTVSE